jgi:large subunit ribosomal protein L4
MKISILNKQNKASGDLDLDDKVFGLTPREDILSRVVTWQLAKKQAGTHQTKEIWAVSGTTKKMYKQKGTGSARHGSKRGAQFRGGGIIFGPVTRDHSYDLPKKVRKLGLRMALSEKMKQGNLIVVDELALDAAKTKSALKRFDHLKGASALLIDDAAVNENMKNAVANLNTIDILPQIGANVYDILKKDKLIMTVAAVKTLEARLK